jgi:hypothetical protein
MKLVDEKPKQNRCGDKWTCSLERTFIVREPSIKFNPQATTFEAQQGHSS